MTCLEPVCRSCVTHNHGTHIVLTIDEAFGKIHGVLSNRPDVVEYFDEFMKQVDDVFERLVSQLHKQRDDVVTEARTRLLDGISITMENMRDQMTNIHQWDKMAGQNPMHLLHIFGDLRRRMFRLSKCVEDTDEVKVPSFTVTGGIHKSIGNLNHSYKRARLIEPSSSVEEVPFNWRRFDKPVRLVRVPDRPSCGIAVSQNGLLIISCYYTDTLIFVSPETGEIVNTMSKAVHKFDSPGGIAVDKTGNIWVVDRGHNRVCRLNWDATALLECFDTKNQPYGICILDNDNLAVSHDTEYGDDSCVIIYNQKGDVILDIKSGIGTFRDVKYHSGQLYVTASTRHKVLVFSTDDGTFIREFGEGMEWCNGICIAPDGHVLVTEADPLHCVSIWSPSGEFVQRIGTKTFDHPYHLTILPNNRLVVVDKCNNQIQIF